MQTGKLIMLAGVFIFLAGMIWFFWGDKFQWVGKLPGDIRIEKENFRFYFPLTTMILVSVVISVVAILVRKFLN